MKDFKAEISNGILVVKPIIEKKGNDVIIHVPSLPLIKKLKLEHEEKQNGKRDL